MIRLLPLEVTTDNFAEAMDQAIGIEIATLPVYLSGYYSIIRAPDQDKITASLAASLDGQLPARDIDAKALELSAQIMVFANYAGATIMSVAMEEMLHMSLASNVHQALIGPPSLTGKSPQEWPAYLPGHEPPFAINRGPLSRELLKTWMKIESPNKFKGPRDLDGAIEYTTIGEFYDMVIKCIEASYKDDDQYDKKRPQLVPKRGYYAANTIDTLFYDKEHEPHFVNAEDSGDLIHVKNCHRAVQALNEIVHQGEGSHKEASSSLHANGEPRCDQRDLPGDYDDLSHKELSHFKKFNDVYCRLVSLEESFKTELNDPGYDVKQWFVYDMAVNPYSADYPEAAKACSDLTNALYSYLFIMSQDCYRRGGNTQYEVFMAGIHKSMMWVFGSMCGDHLPNLRYVDATGQERVVAPTFEEWRFSGAVSPKREIIALHAKAQSLYPKLANIGKRIQTLPDVPLQPYTDNEVGRPILNSN